MTEIPYTEWESRIIAYSKFQNLRKARIDELDHRTGRYLTPTDIVQPGDWYYLNYALNRSEIHTFKEGSCDVGQFLHRDIYCYTPIGSIKRKYNLTVVSIDLPSAKPETAKVVIPRGFFKDRFRITVDGLNNYQLERKFWWSWTWTKIGHTHSKLDTLKTEELKLVLKGKIVEYL